MKRVRQSELPPNAALPVNSAVRLCLTGSIQIEFEAMPLSGYDGRHSLSNIEQFTVRLSLTALEAAKPTAES